MIEGVFAPIITPFKENEEIDFDRMKHNLDLWSKSGLTGVVVLGSNGEFAYLSAAEKLEIVRFVKDQLDSSKKIVVGTGCETTKDTIELTQKVSETGIDAVLVLPPYYYKSLMKEDVLAGHFEAVADESPVPVMLYNMPANTGINLPSSLASELSRHKNIVGIKDSSGNIVQIAETVKNSVPEFSVFAGSAGFMLPALAVGARGATVALGNIMPDECSRLFSLFREGKMEEARELQYRLLEINFAITAGMGIPALKAAMDMLGFQGGFPRRPLRVLVEEKRKILEGVLKRCGAVRES